MSGFLDDMARSSMQRVVQAAQREPIGALERRAEQTPAGPPLRLSPAGFDVIAELKLRSPAAGALGRRRRATGCARIAQYARGGAAAVSVLTEPSRFDGSLEHLRQAAAMLAPLGIPAMRKDFIVDPYQVLEARAAGAGGVLIILRMLRRARGSASSWRRRPDHGLFVLLEAFDAEDLDLVRDLADPSRQPAAPLLIGVNCRDLKTLHVVQERFSDLAPLLPAGWPAVAESGVASAADARSDAPARLPAGIDRHGVDGERGSRAFSCLKFSMRHGQCNLKWLHSLHMWIKICGITSADAISAAAAAKVDAIGFVFAPSPRQVTPGQAAQLAALAPPEILRIAVAQHPLQMKVDEICRILKPDYFQTDVEDLRELKIPAHIKVLPVVRFGRKTPSPLPARIMFEGPSSGIGELADWGRAAELARQTEVILAGRPFGAECRGGHSSGAAFRRRCEQRRRSRARASRIRTRSMNSCVRRVPRPHGWSDES